MYHRVSHSRISRSLLSLFRFPTPISSHAFWFGLLPPSSLFSDRPGTVAYCSSLPGSATQRIPPSFPPLFPYYLLCLRSGPTLLHLSHTLPRRPCYSFIYLPPSLSPRFHVRIPSSPASAVDMGCTVGPERGHIVKPLGEVEIVGDNRVIRSVWVVTYSRPLGRRVRAKEVRPLDHTHQVYTIAEAHG